MESMTQNQQPVLHDILVHEVTNMVQFEDKGLNVIPLETDWGCCLKFQRQGKTLPWRVTINQEGRLAIYKPMTASMPKVALVYPHEQWERAKVMLAEFIQGGWL